jgi:thymidine phosphorylase
MVYKADRRLYHNADRSKILEEGDEGAAFLLAAEGQEFSDEEASRLGLDKVKPNEVIDLKQVKGPEEDKSEPPRTARRT